MSASDPASDAHAVAPADAPAPRDRPAVRVAVAQLPGRVEALDARLDRAERAVADSDADLVLLPEACVPGYTRGAVPPSVARRGAAWARSAAARHGRHVAVGLVEERASVLLLAAPDGRTWRYAKRFVTVAEARRWRPGDAPGLAQTDLGPIGLAVCADLVQPGTWAALAGRVELALVAAAWPDYRGRKQRLPLGLGAALSPLLDHAGAQRDAVLAALPAVLGAPVAWCNAGGPWQHGEGFAGGSRVLSAEGAVLAQVEGETGLAVAELALRAPSPGPPLQQSASWQAFHALHRAAARARAGLLPRS